MSKEEFLKIQTCILKVNIHCNGCKQKVKKILQKIDGVYTINIDSEQGKVTVSGDVDPSILIKKLTKNGKHAELWGASNVSNNTQSQLNDQQKALQIEQAKCANNKGQNQKGGNSQPKGGPPAGQLPQLPQMKGFQDLKMPPQFMKDMKMPPLNKNQNQKSVRFNLPEDEDLSDDEEDDDDELDDDDLEDAPLNKMKPMMGNGQGGPQMPKMLMSNMMGGNIGGNGGGNAKGVGGGGGNIPVQMNIGSGGGGGGGNGGNKGNHGNNYANNQSQGGGKGGKKSGGQPQGSKNGGGGGVVGGGGGGQFKLGAGSGGSGDGVANGNNFMANVANKGGGTPNMMGMNPGGSLGLMGSLPVRPAGQISNLAAVQGLPTSAMNTSGGGAGPGYLQGGPLPEHLAGNPYYQQQLAAMMVNQQQTNGNERFQPMMYAPPPPAVNYMPPPPYPPQPYPYAPPPGGRNDHYTMFNDEDTSSCSVM
ncbi:uncharacterized protein [Primulina eburnea]|uniref:uncharacterized protein n=1 Tax=Primulina eburnea TaxID=1245227 RepID=UPI003C6CB6D9